MPGVEAAQHVRGPIDLPEGAMLPPERLADGLEHPRCRLDEGRRLGEGAGRLVDDPPLLHARPLPRLVRAIGVHEPDQYYTTLGACLSNTNTLRVGRLRRQKSE